MPLQEELESQGNFLFRYRGSLPIIVLIAALLVFVQQVRSCDIPSLYFYLCFVTCLLGLAVRIYTVGHTPKNTSGRNTKSQIADEINTTGIYSTVRHPLYVGNFFMWLGAAMLTHQLWFILFFVAAYWIYYERIMYAEEQFLRGKFGTQYLNWASQTPAFIPSITQFTSPKYSFSLKKVLQKEINGLLNIFIVFTLFDLIYYYIKHQMIGMNDYFWLAGVIGSFVAYLILKIVSKNTTALVDEGRM